MNRDNSGEGYSAKTTGRKIHLHVYIYMYIPTPAITHNLNSQDHKSIPVIKYVGLLGGLRTVLYMSHSL